MRTQERTLMKKRILFVDDEPSVLDGLRRMLRAERGRWDMSFVGGADAALEVMHASDFDAVVSDVSMPGKDGFSDEEWEIMSAHCQIGAEILREDPRPRSALLASYGEPAVPLTRPRNPVLAMAASVALTHHERWDGSGYPAGLVGEEIPLESRIVAVADVYDAVRSERPYKRAHSEDKALEIIANEAGRHFAPDVYAAFSDTIDEFQAIRAELADDMCCSIGRGAQL